MDGRYGGAVEGRGFSAAESVPSHPFLSAAHTTGGRKLRGSRNIGRIMTAS